MTGLNLMFIGYSSNGLSSTKFSLIKMMSLLALCLDGSSTDTKLRVLFFFLTIIFLFYVMKFLR